MRSIHYALAILTITLLSISSGYAVTNATINFGQPVKTLYTNQWGFNNHLDYQGSPTWLDNDSSGSAETLSNITWHRAKAVEAGVSVYRGDTRWSSKYAGLNQGILDNQTNYYKASGTPYNSTSNSSTVGGWNFYYQNVNYYIDMQTQPFDPVNDATLRTYAIDDPGNNTLKVEVSSDIFDGPAFGKAVLWQSVSGTANNGSKFDILLTTTQQHGSKAGIITDATCTNNNTVSLGLNWYRIVYGNCTKTAGTAINVSIYVPGSFFPSNDIYIGGVRLVYSSNQETMMGWRTDTLNNFANINSDRDMVEWAYNETNNGRNTKVGLTGFHMPVEIANLTSYCTSDTRGCSYSDEYSFTDMVQSYILYVTNNGQYCSAIDSFGVWNEPDLTTYWLDDLPTGNSYRWEEYNRMYNVTWNAVKNSVCGPSIKVAGQDLASITSSDGTQFINSWLGNFTPQNMIDVILIHRYPSATTSDPATSARSIQSTINTTKTLASTYGINLSSTCVQFGELNENNQNIVQNLTNIAEASYNAMMAEIATQNICLYLTWYQWADDSPWGTSTAEGNSTGIRRIAVQEPLNGGEQLYSLYNASKEFFNKAPGNSVIYNSTDNDTLVYLVPAQSNLTIRFGIVNTKNSTETINITFLNTTAISIVNERNGTTYNITGTGSSKTALITGIQPYDTEWYALNTTYTTITNGTCFTTSYANYCFNTDVYIFNNATLTSTALLLDDWELNFTTTTAVINITIDSWDIYGNNSMRITSPLVGNVVTGRVKNTVTGTTYTNIYSGTPYSYGTGFVANTASTNYYYTTSTTSINHWFVNATNNNTGNLVTSWGMNDLLYVHYTNNGSILFNGLQDSTGNGNTLTNSDCTATPTTTLINSYLSCNNPSTLPKLGPTNNIFTNNNTFGISTFFRAYNVSPNGTPNTILFLSRDDGSTGNNSAITLRTKNNSTLEMSFRNGSNSTETFTLATISTGQWYHVAISYDAVNIRAYVNNILVLNTPRTFFGFGSNNASFSGLGSGERYTGDIGVTQLFNSSISASKVSTLYSLNYTLLTPYSLGGQTALYSFRLFDPVSTDSYTISSSGYETETFSSVYSGSPYTFILGQTFVDLNITVKETITNNLLSNYTITLTGPETETTTVNTTTYNAGLITGNYNYTVNKTGYYNKTGNFTVTNTTTTVTIENLTSHYLAVRFRNSILNINETNFTVSAYSSNYNITITQSTTNGTVIIPWFSDSNFNITAFNGINTSNTLLTTNTTNVTGPETVNYTLSGVISNSVYFSFFDEQTQELLNGTNVTVYVTSSTYTYNFTEISGNRTVNNIQSGTYVVTATAPGYVTRTYNFVLETGGSAQQVIYLLSNSSGSYIRFTVLDQSYNVLQEATINAVRKNISGTNYYEVGDCTTDNNGECIINLETLTATYRFVACYQTTCYTTPDTTLSRDTYPIVINLGSNGLEEVFEDSNIQTGLTYNNGTFSYTVIDTNNNVRSSYVTISRINGGREIPLETITGTGTTIVLTTSYQNVSIGDGIVARGYTVMQGNPVLTSILTAVPNNLGTGRNASLILLFLGLTITVVFIFSWNPIAPPIIFGVMLMIFQRIGLVTIGVETLAAVFVIIGIAIFRMRNV